jgi:hypothetical protein
MPFAWDRIQDAVGRERWRRRLQAAALLGFAFLFVAAPAAPQARKPHGLLEQFVIGRRTFFDIGPPFEFYEIFSVHRTAHNGTSVERIVLTPPGDVWPQPASIEVAVVSTAESVGEPARWPCGEIVV